MKLLRDVGLHEATDDAVWEFAVRHGLVVVSRDSDFHERSLLAGPPPKVVWIRRPNRSTGAVKALLRTNKQRLDLHDRDLDAAFVILD